MSNETDPSYTEAARRELARRAAAILQEQLDELTATAEDVEQATGVRIVRRRHHILDARRHELEALRTQAQAWLLVMAIVDRLMLPGDTRSIGDLSKTLPARELAQLRRALRLAGALNDGGDIR